MPNWLRLASCLVAAGALKITDLNGEWAWEYADSVENDGKTEFFCVDASSGRVDSVGIRNEYTRGFVVAASDGTGDLYYHQYYVSGGAAHDQGNLMCKISATNPNRCVGSYHSDTSNAVTDTKPFTFVRVVDYDESSPPVKPNPEQCFQVSAAMDRAFITNRGSVDPLFTMNGFWGSAVNPSQWACVEGDRFYSSYEYLYKEDGKPDRKVSGYSQGYVRFGGQVASVIWYEPDAFGDEIMTLVSENQLRLSWFMGGFDAAKFSDPVQSGVDMLTRFTTKVFPGDCEKYACALSGSC